MQNSFSSSKRERNPAVQQVHDIQANQAFVESIMAFSKNMESEKISLELQSLFLKLADG